MKKKRNIILVFSMLIIFVVAATIAYFFNGFDYLTGFDAKRFDNSITELFVSPQHWKPGDITEKYVSVTNDNDWNVAVRISYSEKWETANGDILDNKPDGESAAVLHFVNKDDWIKDGNYYYYDHVLTPGSTTSDFIDSVIFNKYIEGSQTCSESQDGTEITCVSSGDGYDNATYTLTLNVDITQYDSYKKAWNTSFEIGAEENHLAKNFAEYIINNSNPISVSSYQDGVKYEPFAFSHSDTTQLPATTDYRYIGNRVNNRVYYNCTDDSDVSTCEIWRIIGVFDVSNGIFTEKRVKLIREDVYDMMNLPFYSGNYWGQSNVRASLNSGDYWNSLSTTAKTMISTSRFYTSKMTVGFNSAEAMYNSERTAVTYMERPYYFDDNVGLIYTSDYAFTFAYGVDVKCYSSFYNCNINHYTDNYGDPKNSWIYNTNKLNNSIVDVATINYYYYNYNDRMLYISNEGDFSISSDGGNFGIRPVVYLESGVGVADGDGTRISPYVLSYISHNINVDSEIFSAPENEFPNKQVDIIYPEKYALISYKLNGELMTSSSFFMPNKDVYITDIQYEQIKYDVISNDDNLDYPLYAAKDSTVTLSSKSGLYEITGFTMNGEDITGNSFVMPDGDAVITDVIYNQIGYYINCDDVDIDVPNIGIVGETINLTSNGYAVTSFKLNGNDITGNSFVMPEEDVNITDVTKVEKVVVESEHNPYLNSINRVYYENTFEGATSITVELTYQTESTSYDYIYLYSSSSTIYGSKYGGSTLKTETITIPSNYIKILFKTDSSVNNYYGFRAVITPNYE